LLEVFTWVVVLVEMGMFVGERVVVGVGVVDAGNESSITNAMASLVNS
jgi:hypothetical protein